MKRAVFLDRDGTIIEDGHYLADPAGVVLIPGAATALRRMREKGYLLFVVSNQSGVSRGLIDDKAFLAVHRRVCELLQSEGVEIAEFAYCFHHPDDRCDCRKPAKGLVAAKFGDEAIDWTQSYTVGDKPCDVELADAIGGKGFLVLTGKGKASWETLKAAKEDPGGPAFTVCPSLVEVADSLPPCGNEKGA